MSNINVVVIEGNLTRAAELSRWNDGTPYCKFTIANNESYKDPAGQWKDNVSFIDCMCKGNYAESMSKHLLKGRRVTITGRLKQTRWQDEGGTNRSSITVKVQNISLVPVNSNKNEVQHESQIPEKTEESWEVPENNFDIF